MPVQKIKLIGITETHHIYDILDSDGFTYHGKRIPNEINDKGAEAIFEYLNTEEEVKNKGLKYSKILEAKVKELEEIKKKDPETIDEKEGKKKEED